MIDLLCINPIRRIGLIHKGSIDSRLLKWSVQVNVLLNNCKQNITSLSLLVCTTVHCHAMFHLQCVDLGYCLCDATTALTGPLTGIAADGATGQLTAGGGDCIIAPYTQDYAAGSK